MYQVYVRSFADSDGDGVGDLDGIRERLGYLELLGVDALLLTSDPAPAWEPTAFDRLVAEAHRVGMRVAADNPRPAARHRLAAARFDAVELRTAIDATLDKAAMADVPPAWAVAHHEATRPPTRYGDGPLGTQRARAMALVALGLPGVVHLYNGEELGLPDVPLPDGGHGCRVPLPWEGAEPPFGFSPTSSTWLPVPADWAKLTVERQLEYADSTLSLYRQAIELRRTHRAFSGGELEWYGAPAGCFAYRRRSGGLVCVLNGSETSVPMPAGEVLLASGPLNDRYVPPNTAAWLARLP